MEKNGREKRASVIPERFLNEWFELIQDWEGEHSEMAKEYQWFLAYCETQSQLKEFPPEAQHRIYSEG